jgi:PIN domain-containing protein
MARTMKDLFPGHYTPAADVLRNMWRDGLISVDTNVLLDVFRVSDETARQLLGTLERLRDHLWLPYQVAKEYHSRVEIVIAEQTKPYDEASKQLSALLLAFNAPRNHPFLDAALLRDTQALFEKLEKGLQQRRASLQELLNQNPLKERIAVLFDGRVGAPFTPAELDAIYGEGRDRYERHIPPGFADGKDKPEPQRYGDLVIWKSLLAKLGAAKVPGIYVTSDVKDDWFHRVAGRTIGPRPELIEEMKREAGIAFHIYTTLSFLQYANEFLDAGVGQDAIKEVQELEQVRRRRASISSELFRIRRRIRDTVGSRVAELRRVPVTGSKMWVARLEDGRQVIMDAQKDTAYAVFTKRDNHIVVESEPARLKELIDSQPGGAKDVDWLVNALNSVAPQQPPEPKPENPSSDVAGETP